MRFLRLPKPVLAVMLVCTLFATACSVSQFEAVLNEVGPAVQTILDIMSIIKGTPVNTTIAAKVDADVAGLEKLYNDWNSAAAASKPGIEAEINAGFNVLSSDLGLVFAIAQVSDTATQAKIEALVGIIQTGVNIAEALIPNASVKVSYAKRGTPNLTAEDLANSWNGVLVAKTGNPAVDAYTSKHKLHYHSKLVRVLALGHVN